MSIELISTQPTRRVIVAAVGVLALAAGAVTAAAPAAAGDGASGGGVVFAWGMNDLGEAVPPPGLTNVVAVAGRYWTLRVYLQGVTRIGRAFPVRLGRTYTIVARTGIRPRYYDAAPAPQRPFRADNAFLRAGRGVWALGVRIDPGMHHYRYWNLGVRFGRTMYILRVRVT